MSDNEIIKALECCQTNDESKCVDCPYCDDCVEKNNVVADTLDLINRQQEEIDKLKIQLSKGEEFFNIKIDTEQLERIVKKEVERVIKVITCKDCKYFSEKPDYCHKLAIEVEQDFGCKYGEW